MAVHHIDMQQRSAPAFHGAYGVSQTRKVRGQNGWGDFNGSRHAHWRNSIIETLVAHFAVFSAAGARHLRIRRLLRNAQFHGRVGGNAFAARRILSHNRALLRAGLSDVV